MKFKSIFLLFNIILAVTFLVIAVFPLIILGGEYGGTFLRNSFPLLVLFASIIALFNYFFLSQWKVFEFLEKENWKELSLLLKTRFIEKKRINKLTLRIFLSSSVIAGNMDAIEEVFGYLSKHKKRLVRAFSLSLGIPFFAGNRMNEAIEYYRKALDQKGIELPLWHRWVLALCYVVDKQSEPVVPLLEPVLKVKRPDPVLLLLSIYLLVPSSADHSDLAGLIEKQRAELLEKFPSAEIFRTEIRKSREEILILSLFGQVSEDALRWLYASSESDSRQEG